MSRLLTVFLTGLLYLSSEPAVRAQMPYSYVFRHITTSDGLAGNKVFGMFCDDRGFMWISTINGLQRYDGNSFMTWHHSPADSTSLSEEGSVCLMEDHEKKIWLSSWPYGFTIFDPRSGKSRRFLDQTVIDPIGACEDKEGNAWLVSSDGLREVERNTHQVISMQERLLPHVSFAKPVFYDRRSDLIYINSLVYGLCVFDRIKRQLYCPTVDAAAVPWLAGIGKATPLLVDQNQGLWVNTVGGRLLRVDPVSGKRMALRLIDRRGATVRDTVRITGGIEDEQGTVWFASSTGLVRWVRGTTTASLIGESAQDPNGLHSDNELRCFGKDREGNIWIGTDAGINIFNPAKEKFVSVPVGDVDRHYPVMCFHEMDNGDIWLGTYGDGIYVYDRTLHFKHHYVVNKDRPTDPRGLPGANIWSFLSRADGRMLIGYQHGWLSIYDPVRDVFSNFQPPGLEELTIANMLYGPDSAVWMALYRGVGKWDMRRDEFHCYRTFIPFRGGAQSVATDLALVGGRILVTTVDHGLQELDPVTGEYVKADTPVRNSTNGISSMVLQSIVSMDDTLLAMGTGDEGIDILNTKSGKHSYYGTADGLPGNYVAGLYYQRPRWLWAATEQGLCRIDLMNRHVTVYGTEDGIVQNDFANLLRFCRLRDGHVLAGYNGGFVRFDPDSLSSRAPPADVTITGIRVFEQPLSIDSILKETNTAVFSYRQNFISIQYSSLGYSEPGRIKYYYQLEGVDRSWVSAGRRHVASYTGLSDGHYVFRVRCENNDRISSVRETSFKLIIVPPFWRTWWFYILSGTMLVLLLYGLYRYRINQILALYTMRNKISKDLHDDLGATLSSIAVLSEVARNTIDRGFPQQTFPMLEKISTYSRDMVDKMRDLVWTINPGKDSLEDIIKRLNTFSTEACAERGITFRLQLQDGFINLPVPMGTRKNLYLICKEAIHNAIIHADCSEISAFFNASGKFIIIRVMDNGKGFDGTKGMTGNGLTNMRSRAAEIRASLEIDPGEPGTVLELRLAVPKIRS